MIAFIIKDDTDPRKVGTVSGDMTLAQNVTLPEYLTLTIPDDMILTIPSGRTLPIGDGASLIIKDGCGKGERTEMLKIEIDIDERLWQIEPADTIVLSCICRNTDLQSVALIF
jgi:hypothetical protein